MNQPKVSIIILNWNGWQDTIECLESLYRITYPNFEVIVIDNASKDGSINKILSWAKGKQTVSSKFFTYSKSNKPIKYLLYTKQDLDTGAYLQRKKALDKFPSKKKLFILQNDTNRGFAEGNNIAIRQILSEGKSKYILLLNNDTIVNSNFLTELVRGIPSDSNIGIAGPKIYYYDYFGKTNIIQTCGSYVNLYKGFYGRGIGEKRVDSDKFNHNLNVEFITGACLLIKSDILEKVNLLEEKWFMYYEDLDLCTKVLRSGYKIKNIFSAKIWHKLSATSHKTKDNSLYYRHRNLIFFEKRYCNTFQLYIFYIYYFFKYFMKYSVGYFFIKKDYQMFKLFIRAVKDGYIG